MSLSPIVLTYLIPKGGSGRVLVYQRGSENNNRRTIKETMSVVVVMFCGGFPDDIRVFQPLANRLASSARHDNHYIICGVTCPPGYDSKNHSPPSSLGRSYGYDFDDMAKSIGLATRALKAHCIVPSTTKTVGIFHDWGSFGGSICANLYCDFHAIVYIDVLPPPPSRNAWTRGISLWQGLIWSLYTSLLAVTHATQLHLSQWLAVVPWIVGGVTLKVLGLLPIQTIDFKTLGAQYKKDPLSTHMFISMMYPYYHMYKNLILGRPMFGKGSFLTIQTPTLFIYGVHKRVHFHTNQDLLWMGQFSHMTSVAVHGAGHWLFLQEPDIAFQEIDKFLAKV